MLIKQVFLKNWKSHKETRVEFDKGTNVIVGIIGSGKSSILEAIVFALFGSSANISKLENLIKNKPIKENYAKVELVFNYNGKDYKVVREIELDRTSASLYVDGKLIESGSERVNEYIENELKIRMETFSRVIYCEQDNMDFLFRLPRNERVKKIDEMLLIDKLENVRKNSVTLKNRLIDLKNGMEKGIRMFDKQSLEKKIHEYKQELFKINSQIIVKEGELKEKNILKEKIENEVIEIEKSIEILNEIEKELVSLNSKIEEISADLNRLEGEVRGLNEENLQRELNNLKKNIEESNKKISSFQDKKLSLEKEKSSISAKISLKETNILEKRKKLEEIEKYKNQIVNIEAIYGKDIEKSLKEFEEREKKLLEEKHSTIAKMKEAESSINTLKQPIAKCPICDRELSEESKKDLLKHKEKHLENLKNLLLEVEKNIKEISEKISDYRAAKEKYDKLKILTQDYEQIKSQIDSEKEEVEKLKINLFKIEEELKTIDRFLAEEEKKIEALEEIELKYEKQIEKLIEYKEKKKKLEYYLDESKNLSKKKEEIASLIPPDFEEKKKLLESLLVEISTLNTKLKSIFDKKDMYERILIENEEKLKELISLEEEIKKISRYIEFLIDFESSLKYLQSEIREEFLKNINVILPQVWNELYPYGDFVELKIFHENGDYVIKLKDKFNRWSDVNVFASGGERTLANICFRISLASVLAPNIKVLLMDEPTHNLDENSVKMISKAFRESINKFVDQIIVITHDSSLVEAASAKVYRVERRKEIYEESKVIKESA